MSSTFILFAPLGALQTRLSLVPGVLFLRLGICRVFSCGNSATMRSDALGAAVSHNNASLLWEAAVPLLMLSSTERLHQVQT